MTMATSREYIEFVCEQISGTGHVRYRKMFGEYMVYVNDKPLLLVCDNTVYVKKLDILTEILRDSELGVPYGGAKEHYILDIDNIPLCENVISVLEPITPVPKKKNNF